jgi:hypothetical protein
MRIVDRETFLALPAGTIFMKFPAQPGHGSSIDLTYDGEIAIKGETAGADFVVQSLFPWFETDTGSDTHIDRLVDMLKGEESPPLDYDCSERDGLFDPKQLFAVWNHDDAERLVARLRRALSEGYSAPGKAA